MAKTNKTTETPAPVETAVGAAQETPVETATEATAAAPAAETAMVSAVDAEIEAAHPDSLSELVKILPHKKDALLSIRKVKRDEFTQAMVALDDGLRENFTKMLARMNPARTSREMGEQPFRPITLRLYQGVGEKPKNPKLPKGGVEDASGNIVLVPEAFKEDFEGIPQKLAVSMVFMAAGRAYWPKVGTDGKPQLPPGLELKPNQMVCGSNDRVVGTRYGACSACPYRPDFGKSDRPCKDHVDVFFMTPDLKAVYQVTMGVTSFKSAVNIITSKTSSWESDWDGQFWLETELVERDGRSYCIWKISTITNRTNPNGLMNSDNVKAVMELMSRQIHTEVYFPRLAATYQRSEGTTPEVTPTGNLSELEKSAAGMNYGSGSNTLV